MAEWNVAHITPKDVVILRQNDVMSKIREGILNLPNSFNGGGGSYFVMAKAIWNDAFAGVDQLEYVASTRDVKFIGARAFENCVALKGLLKEELPECVRGMVGIIPAGERDSVEEYHRHLVEKYDFAE